MQLAYERDEQCAVSREQRDAGGCSVVNSALSPESSVMRVAAVLLTPALQRQ